MRDFTIAVVVLAVLGALTWGVRSCILLQDASLGPAEKEVERRNFEHTQTYREGLRRDCDELMLAYSRAKTDDERASTLAVLRHRVQGAPQEAIPQDCKEFVNAH